MSVPFPYTSNGVGSGFGRVVVSPAPLASIDYESIPQIRADGQRGTTEWLIDRRFVADSNTFAACLSALNTNCAGVPTVVSLQHVPSDFSVSGASLGLAVFLSTMGIRTDICVTGFVQTFGVGASAVGIECVDSVDAKISFCQQHGIKLVVPAQCESHILHRLLLDEQVTTYANLLTRRGRLVFTVGAADSVSDLAFVLCAMDTSLSIEQFVPRSTTAVSEVQSERVGKRRV